MEIDKKIIKKLIETLEDLKKSLNPDQISDVKKTVEESNNLYGSILDKTTESLEKILLNTESISKVQ